MPDSDLDAKLSLERDRLVQQLAGLADALNGLPPERLADVLPIVAGVDAIAQQVRQAGVAVTTEYPSDVDLPVDERVFARLFGGASILRNN